jgi:hypothetical protein
MSVEGSTFNRNSNAPLATAPLRPIRPTERALGATSRCSSSDLGGFGVDSTPESRQKNGRSSSEQVSVALPQQLIKAMGSLLASLSARDLSTGLSSQRAGLLVASLAAVVQPYASSDRFISTIVHAAEHRSDSLSTGRTINPSPGISSRDLPARPVRQRCDHAASDYSCHVFSPILRLIRVSFTLMYSWALTSDVFLIFITVSQQLDLPYSNLWVVPIDQTDCKRV